MTNKTFKCPKCGDRQYGESNYEVDGKKLRVCSNVYCSFAWSHLNDHLYLKDAEPEEITRHDIIPPSANTASGHVCFVINGSAWRIHKAVSFPGFSGFEFEDGSVSLELPWAWKGERTGRIYHGTRSQEELADYTPVLAKFVRIKEAS